MSVQDVMATADMAAQRRAGVTVALAVLVVLLALISLGIGPVRLSPLTVIEALFGGGSDVSQVIVREIRLPRTILGFAIGAILGLAGAAPREIARVSHETRVSGPLHAADLDGDGRMELVYRLADGAIMLLRR